MGKKYEVVVSGISGKFPECNSLLEFEEYLNSKTNLVTVNDSKWKTGTMNIPDATGKIIDKEKVDASYFGFHPKLTKVADQRMCMCYKSAFEAIIDAGISPAEIYGTNTAVLIGSTTDDFDVKNINTSSGQYSLLGSGTCMQSNRLSFVLNLKGHSAVIDGSWPVGMSSLALGYKLVSEGRAMAAIVGATNLIHQQYFSIGLAQLGNLSHSDKTKSFCDDADGYNRSDGVVIMVLQRAEDARRSYGSIVNLLVENYGSQTGRLVDFSPNFYRNLLKQVYTNGDIDLSQLGFLELDGCGIKNIDAAELDSAADVLCPKRKDPLLVGSVKSNIGHCENAAAAMSVVKALIALDSGVIPPNLNYSSANSKSKALINGKLQVVTTPTTLPGDLVGVSSIGLCGTYGHVILKRNPKPKLYQRSDDLPRLVLVQGRHQETTKDVLKKISTMEMDEEFIALLHHIYKRHVPRFYAFGYIVLGNVSITEPIVKEYQGVKPPIWYVFSGMGSQWPEMGRDLLRLPTFSKAVEKCHKVLEPKGIDLIHIITNQNPSTFDCILNSFVGIAAIQIGLVEVLRALGIKPDGVVGHSLGELGCAYADGCLTAEQTVLCAYARGLASIETKLIKGKMAAVGIGYEEIKKRIPDTIDIACHNSASNCTLSGPDDEVEIYLDELKKEGVFVKLINVANIAYHSRYIEPAGPTILKYLKEVIPEPKPRSPLWISSSVSESQSESEQFKYCSAEYHANNFLSPVLFEEASRHIPKGAVIVEIAPHGLLQAILRRSHSKCVNIRLTNKFHNDGLLCLLDALGKLYLEGVEMDLTNIYPKVEFPVSRRTHSLNNLVAWNLEEITKLDISYTPLIEPLHSTITLRASEEKWKSHFERKVYNRLVLPPSVFLSLVIDNIKKKHGGSSFVTAVEFQNVNFYQEVEVNPYYATDIAIKIHKGTSQFEFDNGVDILARGTILEIQTKDIQYHNIEKIDLGTKTDGLGESEVYGFMRTMGFENLSDSLRNVKEVALFDNGATAKVNWRGEWMPFLDALFQILSFYFTVRRGKLNRIKSIRQITIDPTLLLTDCDEVEIYFDNNCQLMRCKGLQLVGVLATEYELSWKDRTINKFLTYQFVPYSNYGINDAYGALTVCASLLLQNASETDCDSVIKVTLINTGRDLNYLNMFYDILCRHENVKISIVGLSTMDSFQEGDLDDLSGKCCCILSADQEDPTAIYLLKNIQKSYLLTLGCENTLLSNETDLSAVFDYQKGIFPFCFLKKVSSLGLEHTAVCLSDGDWETKLASQLKDTRHSLVYVYGELVDDMSVWEMVGLYNNSDCYHRIRFIFYDRDCPEFSLEDPFYQCQIKKDLKLNVCRRGVWGSVILVPRLSRSVTEQSRLSTSHRMEGIDLKCLGIRCCDEFKNSRAISTQLDLTEYSGITTEGRELFGICSVTAYGTLVPDPVLSWEKPPTWSHEEAATVPLLYSMAYHILLNVVERNTTGKNTSLFVNDGWSTVSQAIITIALDLGYEIYTTYNNEKEKKKLRASFPQLKESNIFCHKTSSYRFAIYKLTHFHGINVVINTLEDKWHFDLTLPIVRDMGIYIQLAPGLLTKDELMGMVYFFKSTQFVGIDVNNLLLLSEAKKMSIQKAIERGLERGSTKPLPFKIISKIRPGNHFINKISSVEGKGSKLVLKVTDSAAERKEILYSLKSDNSYLIVGARSDLWIYLIDWLTYKGAKKILLMIDSQTISNSSFRLRCIRNLSQDVTIDILDLDLMSSASTAISYLNDVIINYPLAATFVLDMESDDRLSHLELAIRAVAPNSEFICFGVGERLCNARHKQGLPALCISYPRGRKRIETILPHLDDLISMERDFCYVYVSEYDELNFPGLDSRRPLLRFGYLPRNLNELEDLGRELSGQACFEEVTSLSLRWGITREVPPVFLLPGLRAGLMDRLAASLHYPVFKAKLPASIDNLETVALELAEAMNAFELSAFTIVASDWSCALAYRIAQRLIKLGKYVGLILLDGDLPIEKCATRFLRNNCLKLMKKYFKISSKHLKQLCSDCDWDTLLNALVAKCEIMNPARQNRIINGLKALKVRLENIVTFLPKEKLTCNAICIRPKYSIAEGVSCMMQFLPDSAKFVAANDAHFHDIFDNMEVVKLINEAVLFDRKDAIIDHSALQHDTIWSYLKSGH